MILFHFDESLTPSAWDVVSVFGRGEPMLMENKSASNVVVCLIDKHGYATWASHDPLNYTRKKIVDQVAPEDQEKVLNALSRCILKSEVVEYRAHAKNRDGIVHPWRVRLFPFGKDHGPLACIGVVQMLPENSEEFREDEIKILDFLAEDCTLKEIAEKMFLSESTIDTKIRNLKSKLGVKNIGGLVSSAITSGLI